MSSDAVVHKRDHLHRLERYVKKGFAFPYSNIAMSTYYKIRKPFRISKVYSSRLFHRNSRGLRSFLDPTKELRSASDTV